MLDRLKQIGWSGFFGGQAVLLGLVFSAHYNLYLMPDAALTAVGTFIGAFIFSWIVWLAVKFRMKDRAPTPQYVMLVGTALCLLAGALTGLKNMVG